MLPNNGAPSFNRKERLFILTRDEVIDGDEEQRTPSFWDLRVKDDVCDLLRQSNFFKPRPLQVEAIPLLLKGSDLFVQSKSGSGKSTTISILAAHVLYSTEYTQTPQVLIVVSSREVAQRTLDLITLLLPWNFKAGLFIGGGNVKSDVQLLKDGIQIAIGTCGRLGQLVQERWLKLHNLSLFVLDDADRLLDEEAVRDINFFISSIPPEIKQICMFGTSYPHHLQSTIQKYMRSPTLLHVQFINMRSICPLDYVVFCIRLQKADVLWKLLTRLPFNQCVIFCDTDSFADDVFKYLSEEDDSCILATANMSTEKRNESLRRFADAQMKTLVSTEEATRGVDFPRTDLVFNVRLNENAVKLQAYGSRFKADCATITLLGNSTEAELMYRLVRQNKLSIRVLEAETQEIPKNLIGNRPYFEGCQLFMDHPIITGDIPKDEPYADNKSESPTNNNEVNLLIREYPAREMIEMLDSRPQKYYLDLIPDLPWRHLNEIAPEVLWSAVLSSGTPVQPRYVRNYESVQRPGVYIKKVIDQVRDRNFTDDPIDPIEETQMGEFSEYVTTKSERMAAIRTHTKPRSLFDESPSGRDEHTSSTHPPRSSTAISPSSPSVVDFPVDSSTSAPQEPEPTSNDKPEAADVDLIAFSPTPPRDELADLVAQLKTPSFGSVPSLESTDRITLSSQVDKDQDSKSSDGRLEGRESLGANLVVPNNSAAFSPDSSSGNFDDLTGDLPIDFSWILNPPIFESNEKA